MKKSLLKTALLAIPIFTISPLFGIEHFPNTILKDGHSKTAILYLEYDYEKDFEIKLLDEYSTVLFEENIQSQKDFAKKYNLANLPVGKYFFEIEDLQTITIYEVNIEEKGLNIDTKGQKIYKPTIRTQGQKVYLSMLLLDSSDVNITLLDNDYNVIHSETLQNQMTLERIFNISELSNGSYLIQLENKDRIFNETVSIQ